MLKKSIIIIMVTLFIMQTGIVSSNSAVYNGNTSYKAYYGSIAGVNMSSPGTEVNGAGYIALSAKDAGWYTVESDFANDEPFIRFNFTINETAESIDNLSIRTYAIKHASEAAGCYWYNHTNGVWVSIGAVLGSENWVSATYTKSDISNFGNLVSSNKQLAVGCYGTDYDVADGDDINFDYIVLGLNYTVSGTNNSCVYSGTGNWAINASDHCNLTSTNLGGKNFTITGISTNECCTYGLKNLTNYTQGIISNAYVYK